MARAEALAAARLKGRTLGERVALSAVALKRARRRTAAETIEFAQRALGGGQLLAEAGVESPSFWFAAGALILADGYDLAEPVVESALAEASSQGSTVGSSLGFCFRALLGYRTGRLADAEADARHAVAIDPSSLWAASVYALAFLIDILLDRGRPGKPLWPSKRAGSATAVRSCFPSSSSATTAADCGWRSETPKAVSPR